MLARAVGPSALLIAIAILIAIRVLILRLILPLSLLILSLTLTRRTLTLRPRPRGSRSAAWPLASLLAIVWTAGTSTSIVAEAALALPARPVRVEFLLGAPRDFAAA